MTWFPISGTGVQYVDTNGDPYSGAVLKAYSSGTTTNINMATDSSGGTQVSSIALNATGYPEVSATVVIPHIEEKYKLSLYPTQAAADSDTGAIWTQDNMTVSIAFGSSTQEISTSTALDSSDANTHIEASGTITITLPDIDVVGEGYVFSIRNAGVGVITLDGNGSETINDDLTQTIAVGAGGVVISGSTDWAAIGIKDAQIDEDNIFSKKMSFPDSGELTISSGAITPTGVYHTVDTEADAATDDLDTISDPVDGQILVIQPENAARDIVITDAGNIVLTDGNAITLKETSDTVTLQYSLALTKWVVKSSNLKNMQLLHVQDQKSATTDGGTFTSGAWQTRVLNTSLTNEITGASLATNQITLPAGTYYIESSAPAYQVNSHKSKLYDTTNTADVLIGTAERTGNGDQVMSRSYVRGRFTLTGEVDLEIQHQCETTNATDGFGLAAGFSVIEVYTDVRIWRIS